MGGSVERIRTFEEILHFYRVAGLERRIQRRILASPGYQQRMTDAERHTLEQAGFWTRGGTGDREYEVPTVKAILKRLQLTRAPRDYQVGVIQSSAQMGCFDPDEVAVLREAGWLGPSRHR